MPKSSSVFICQQCGYMSPQFLGKCPECGSWNSLVEQVSQLPTTQSSRQIPAGEVIKLSDVKKHEFNRLSTSIKEFDRVLGGGIVLGSLVLVSGEPGIGKSTLLSQLAINVVKSSATIPQLHANDQRPTTNDPMLYVAGEESAQQIKLRIDRMQKGVDLSILNSTDTDQIVSTINQLNPGLVVVDSIQTIATLDLNSAAGSVSQVRESAYRLQQTAKKKHIPIFIVGHVTKEGTVAGPKTLEHLVDVVISLEGEPVSNFRILRSTKNRFGPTDEIGIFEMEESGLKEIDNPSKLFLDEKIEAPGSAVIATMNGQRPLLIEIQALVTKSNLTIPRRIGTGIDNNRLQLLVAVLSKRLGLPLFDQDIFVNVTGGIKVTEPAADLGIALSIVSSLKDRAINPKTVLVGEIGLLGELRQIRQIEKREAEAKKLGFSVFISPSKAKTLADALKLAIS